MFLQKTYCANFKLLIMKRKILLFYCLVMVMQVFSQNNALHFDGNNDFVAISAVGSNLSNFTIEAWINPETTASDMGIVNTDAWAAGSVHFQFLSGKVVLSVNGLNLSETGGDWPRMTAISSINVWQHIAVTYDGAAKKILFYLNGIECGNYSTPSMPLANITVGSIGAWAGSRFYKGKVDELRIWNKALTSTDISTKMKSELVGTESGLIAYYNFNQGVANGANKTATSLLDKTSNHFNGTLTNFDLGYSSNWIERATGNNCLQFDGVDDYVDISATDAPDFSNGITITGYIQWNKFNSWSRLIDMGVGPNADNILIANNGVSSNLTFSIRKNSTETSITSQTTFGPNQWYYIAFTVSAAGEAKIYVNGVLDKSATGFYLPNSLVRTKQYLGKSNWSSDGYFNGAIDNVSVWNKALSQAEVTTGSTDFAGNEAGLLHYYRFNQGTAAGSNTAITTLTDAVTAGKKDGVLTNFTLQPVGVSNWAAGFVVPSAPDAPTALTAVAGNFKANVSFTPPTLNGGSPIINYTVTSNPGAKTGNGTQSPIVVNGLTAGQAYTFTVIAENAFGSSVTSSASSAVTPFSAPTPVVTSVAVPANGYYKAGDALIFTVNFDIPETVTGSPSLAIGLNTGGTVAAAYVSGSGTNSLVFKYTVATGNVDDDGIIIGTIALNGGAIQSAVGADANITLSSVPVTTGVKVDGVAPLQVSADTPYNKTFIVGQDMDLAANFDENVLVETSLGIPYIKLMVGATVVRATYVSGSGSKKIVFRYTVAINDYDADGIGADLNVQLNGSTFKDVAGNNAVFSIWPNMFFPLSTAKVDGVVPTVTGVIAPANGLYVVNNSLTFTINFSEVVTLAGGTPSLTLQMGDKNVNAPYTGGTGTSSLVFTYTVVNGDFANGIVMPSTITLNGATLKDAIGNNASLTLIPPVTSGVIVDALAPTISGPATATSGNYTVGQNIDISIPYSENVIVTGSPYLLINVGNSTVQANYQSGSGSNTLVFRYAVTATDYDADGVALEADIHLNGGVIRDVANIMAANAFSALTLSELFVNVVPAAVTTQPVTAITDASAIGNGNITSLGSINPTQYGVVWSTTNNPTIALSTKTAQGVAVKGAFTSTMTNLMPLTQYFVRAYATNNGGTTYGDEVSFTTTGSITGIDPVSETVVSVYPNPATDVVNITTGNVGDNGSFDIVSLSGAIVASGIVANGQATAYIATLGSGVYVLDIHIGDKSIRNTILKR